jgi:hypothetical protein
MNGKKIEISVPDGYDFVQDGLVAIIPIPCDSL